MLHMLVTEVHFHFYNNTTDTDRASQKLVPCYTHGGCCCWHGHGMFPA
jgi:hypothetical protein